VLGIEVEPRTEFSLESFCLLLRALIGELEKPGRPFTAPPPKRAVVAVPPPPLEAETAPPPPVSLIPKAVATCLPRPGTWPTLYCER
jgi:hypothetical protein